MSTVSLAHEALRNARIEHSKAQAENIRCRSMATKGLLARAEAKVAKAEAAVAAAKTVALVHGWTR